jgi:hypothetical protein
LIFVGDLARDTLGGKIQAGAHTVTAADPLSGDLRGVLDRIHGRSGGVYLTNGVSGGHG